MFASLPSCGFVPAGPAQCTWLSCLCPLPSHAAELCLAELAGAMLDVSPRQCYVEGTNSGRAVRRCRMTAVMLRCYEHLHEIRGVQRHVAYARRLCKTRVFKSCHLGDLAM